MHAPERLADVLASGLLVVTGSVALAQGAGLSLLGVPTSSEVGELVSLTTTCEAAEVPMLSAPFVVVMALLLATATLVALRRRAAAWMGVLMALGLSTAAPERAESAACDTPVAWSATSASESFLATGPTFEFTPSVPGYVDVVATTGGESEEARFPVCGVGQVADVCGICDGNGAACVCQEALAVGYPGDGNTCNFYSNGTHPGLQDLPGIALDEFTYNEFFSQEYDPRLTGDGAFADPFDPGAPAEFGTVGKAFGCGACVQVSGPNGSAVFFVREIADVAAVGLNGRPRSVHIDLDHIALVRNGAGVAVDVTLQPVPCPFTGSIQLAHRIYSQFYWIGMEYTPYNYVHPIKQIEIKAETGHSQWYDLPGVWTNKYRLDNLAPGPYGRVPLPSPQDGPVRFRITSVYGEVLVTPPIQQAILPLDPAANGWAYYDLGVQFEPRPWAEGACTPNAFCRNFQTGFVGEACSSYTQETTSCASLGAGTGTATCGPVSCTWDTSTCSQGGS